MAIERESSSSRGLVFESEEARIRAAEVKLRQAALDFTSEFAATYVLSADQKCRIQDQFFNGLAKIIIDMDANRLGSSDVDSQAA